MRVSRPRALAALTLSLTALVPCLSAVAAAPSTCSWGARSQPDTVNVAYPDTNATYWSHPYQAVPGTELVIHGTFPRARYFSFHVYQPSGVPLDSVYDAQLRPDPGSTNPFAGSGARPGPKRYTVHVLFTAKPKSPRPNTVYAGQSAIAGTQNLTGILMLRVYVPTEPSSSQGGVPLPTVTWQTTGGQALSDGSACSNDLPDTGGDATGEVNRSSWPEPAPQSVGGAISWGKAFGNSYAGFFGNQQNAYLTAGIDRVYGPLVVIRGRAPHFPDTAHGVWPSRRDQVRYWSFCQNSSTTRVNACADDAQIRVDDKGWFVVVVSDPSQRPRNADAQHGVTWLPWGSADEKAILIYRHMAPAAGFAQSIQRISKSDDPVKVMGAYYPQAHYCTKAQFEAAGWRGCLE